MPNRNEVIGKCIPSCGGDIVKNGGTSACCIKCGLLYDPEILAKNHSKGPVSRKKPGNTSGPGAFPGSRPPRRIEVGIKFQLFLLREFGAATKKFRFVRNYFFMPRA